MRISIENQFFYVSEAKTLPSGKNIVRGSFSCIWDKGEKAHSKIFADVFLPEGNTTEYAQGDQLIVTGKGNIKHYGADRKPNYTIFADTIEVRESNQGTSLPNAVPSNAAPADEHDDLPF